MSATNCYVRSYLVAVHRQCDAVATTTVCFFTKFCKPRAPLIKLNFGKHNFFIRILSYLRMYSVKINTTRMMLSFFLRYLKWILVPQRRFSHYTYDIMTCLFLPGWTIRSDIHTLIDAIVLKYERQKTINFFLFKIPIKPFNYYANRGDI